jgi:hypothetical protein
MYIPQFLKRDYNLYDVTPERKPGWLLIGQRRNRPKWVIFDRGKAVSGSRHVGYAPNRRHPILGTADLTREFADPALVAAAAPADPDPRRATVPERPNRKLTSGNVTTVYAGGGRNVGRVGESATALKLVAFAASPCPVHWAERKW